MCKECVCFFACVVRESQCGMCVWCVLVVLCLCLCADLLFFQCVCFVCVCVCGVLCVCLSECLMGLCILQYMLCDLCVFVRVWCI